MKKGNILVIGESCRDIFVYCEADRLCPDIPVPVLTVVDQIDNPGMAKNVQRNIKSLIKDCNIITNKNWYNITKTRYVHEKSNHTFFRVDIKNEIENIDVNTINYDYDIIVISDYNKGFLTENDIEKICNNHGNVFIDTKKKLGPWVNKAAYIKINDYEYSNSKEYINKYLNDRTIHTMGSNGCEFNNIQFKVDPVEVKDVSGAGDSFMAALVVKYLEAANIKESIIFANYCASEVVKHRGVSTI
jgi:D-beta-D-heptose 7-phosphate kinase/D-beta-D-heptose 1-phosphate adenosyltransferase